MRFMHELDVMQYCSHCGKWASEKCRRSSKEISFPNPTNPLPRQRNLDLQSNRSTWELQRFKITFVDIMWIFIVYGLLWAERGKWIYVCFWRGGWRQVGTDCRLPIYSTLFHPTDPQQTKWSKVEKDFNENLNLHLRF